MFLDVVDFDIAHFFEGHVGFFRGFVVTVLFCHLIDSLNIFLFGLFNVTLLVFDVFDFGYLFGGDWSFAYKVHVLEIGMVEDGRADCGLELFFALYLFVH